LYKYNQYRISPDHKEFETIESYLEPAGDIKYTKNIVVLMNRYTGSAAEDFILMMKVLPNATIVGDYSSGGAGNCPLTRELPNGWIYRIPTCLQLTLEKIPFEGVGIEPDSLVLFEPEDEYNGIDPILDKAVELLLK
jgi:carboxyl-terminal processing protease